MQHMQNKAGRVLNIQYNSLFQAREATHCNTLQHTATHCNTLQHTATYCNTLQHTHSKADGLISVRYNLQ